jgi:hypothetical protein
MLKKVVRGTETAARAPVTSAGPAFAHRQMMSVVSNAFKCYGRRYAGLSMR